MVGRMQLIWTSQLQYHPRAEAFYQLLITSICMTEQLNWTELNTPFQRDSVQFSYSVVSNSLWPHGLQHTRLPCSSPTPSTNSNSCLSSRWCHPTISSSVVTFSSCLHSFPASGYFPMSQFFTSGGQNIGASASVLPVNVQDWFPLGWTGWISLQSKGLSRIFSNTTVQMHHTTASPKLNLWLQKITLENITKQFFIQHF